ncbi:mxaJ protein [Methyloligella halotolerans]|uniref:MxaJ protein n=1 Tax=Methyloligella halotolerans TaxID=1177755 RepID=A0A1E2RX46_9HYPH|nr:methanol oxidation system protein MoxJ [Methyloligella halotolerans]ODA66668.1 mxaJ protein [Methyloligella halotolerans]
MKFIEHTKRLAPALVAAAFVAGLATAGHTADEKSKAASEKTASADVLRVCASSTEAPYSTEDEDGFENKIAKIVADQMGREVEFEWMERPAIYLVRDMLNENKCDVVIGLDHNDPRVLTTDPYYRTAYVFVQPADSELEIDSFDSKDLAKAHPIGFDPGGPVETMLKKLGLYNRNFNYHRSLTNFKSRRNAYIRINPTTFITDLKSGKADLAIVFAPEIARYVTKDDAVKMTVVPDGNYRVDNEPVPFHFSQSMGVRKGDEELLKELNAALEKSQPQIQAVLEEEGIPLLDIPTEKKPESKS